MSRYPPPGRGFGPPRQSHPRNYNDGDRWSARPLQRSRSPIRDRRDSRDFPPPRDFPPRYNRDGPFSAGLNPPDQPRFSGSSFGRGRARPPDWDSRGRPRFQDDRDNFRTSPSRGLRRERHGSVDSRDFDRHDDRRDDYRDRHDDDWRFRPRRDEYPRREPLRLDTRHVSDARSDTVPSPNDRSGRPPSPHRRPSPIDKREFDTSRRPSVMIDLPNKEARRDSERSDVVRPPRDRSPDRAAPTRQTEETSVSVPQFGFIPPVFSTTSKTPLSPNPPLPAE